MKPAVAVSTPYVGRLKVKHGWRAVFGMHSHGHNEIMVMLGGKLSVRAGGEEFQVEKGDALFYAPNVKHFEEADSKEGADFIFFSIPASFKINSKLLVRDPGRRLLTLAHWLAEEREKPFEKRERLLGAYIQAVIFEMEKLSKDRPNSPLSHIRDHIAGSLTENHSVSSLAKRAGMSKFHFIRTYRKYSGLSPVQDLLRMRLESACNLLVTTEMTLKQIAVETGFCDEYYFSRMFRKHLGTTPGAFRHGRI